MCAGFMKTNYLTPYKASHNSVSIVFGQPKEKGNFLLIVR